MQDSKLFFEVMDHQQPENYCILVLTPELKFFALEHPDCRLPVQHIDPLLYIDLQKIFTYDQGHWQVNSQLSSLALTNTSETREIQEAEMWLIREYRVIVHSQYPWNDLGAHSPDSDSLASDSPADDNILSRLEQEYFAVLQSPDLLYQHQIPISEPAPAQYPLPNELLAQGEALQDTSLLEMIEGVMSIKDVEKRMVTMSSDILQTTQPTEDVLALHSDTPSAPSTEMAHISQMNHRTATLHAPMSSLRVEPSEPKQESSHE